jgi:hypothetical protein
MKRSQAILIFFLDTVGPFNRRAVARMVAVRAPGNTTAFSDPRAVLSPFIDFSS